MYYRLRLRYLLIALSLFTIFSAFNNPVYADDANASIELSPVSKRLTLESGQTKQDSFTITNHDESPKKVLVYATPYSIVNDGAQDFEAENGYSQIRNWITFKDDNGKYQTGTRYTIDPGDSKIVEYSIDVPENAPGGGQYATVFVEIEAESNTTNSQIRAIPRVGMVIYSSIEGQTIKEAKIDKIKTNSIIFGNNIESTYEISNNGNIDVQILTEMSVYSGSEKELCHNSKVTTIMPESTQSILLNCSVDSVFEILRVEHRTKVLDSNETKNYHVLVVSPFLLRLTIFIIVALVGVVVYKSEHKAHKKAQ